MFVSRSKTNDVALGVKEVVANDFSEDAVAAIRRNVLHNQLDPTKFVIPTHRDARFELNIHGVAGVG